MPLPADSRPGAPAAAVLLAAGESTRMSQPKQLLQWKGIPLVQYQVSQLCGTAEIAEVVVVLGYRADEVLPFVQGAAGCAGGTLRVVVNPSYREGKTTSIKAGLANLRSAPAAVLILAVDQPRSSDILRRLVQEHVRGRRLITVPSYQDKRGHPPIFDASLIPELLRISEERQGMMEVIERHREGVHVIPIDSPLVLTNLNTPEDYQRAISLPD